MNDFARSAIHHEVMTAGRKPTVSDDDILQVLKDSPDPVLTTKEISEAIGISQGGTYDRLEKLFEDGQLERKAVGPGYVWWQPKSDNRS